MNNEKNDSLIEIAVRLMKNKKKPKALKDLTNEVFQAKGINDGDIESKKAQFYVDFMLSGHFVCCGEDKNGFKLWDLKSRQPSTLLDKDGNYLEDLYADDEDVVKNELKDDIYYGDEVDKDLDDYIDETDDEEEDEEEETDDIQEELGLDDITEEEEDLTTEIVVDEDEEDEEEETDDIEEELKK